MPLENISHIVLILSGKGGVGKSSTTLQLALTLTLLGKNVGILDIDLTGPSIPRLVGLEDQKITQTQGGWNPVLVHGASTSRPPSPPLTSSESTNGSNRQHSENDNPNLPLGSLHAISLGFLLPSRSSAVIWRGPKKTAMIRQFLSDVAWPPLDYLLIDTPPGTSDEHIAVLEELQKLVTVDDNGSAGARLDGAVLVTTPQAISTADVRKELNFCTKTATPVLGVVENMAGFMCPCCGEVSNVFSKGGGEIMAIESGVPFWGSVPVDTGFGEIVEGAKEEGSDSKLVDRYRRCGLSGIFRGFAERLIRDTTK